jgi:hypothetical protein
MAGSEPRRKRKYPQKANENTAKPTNRPTTTDAGDVVVFDT